MAIPMPDEAEMTVARASWLFLLTCVSWLALVFVLGLWLHLLLNLFLYGWELL